MSRPQKKQEDKRTSHLPRTRCTLEERAAIQAKAAQAGLTLSEYQRQACLETAVLAKEPLADVRLIRELNAIGVNLNQLTRKTHIHEDYDAVHLRALLSRLDGLLTALGA